MTSTNQTEPSIPVDRKFRTSDGMFTVSSEHTIKWWNSTAELIFGITSEQAIGRKCHEVLCAKNGSNRVKCNRNCMVMLNAVKGRTTRDFDLDCKTRSGDIKTLNMSVLLTKADSNATEVLRLFRDVTDHRKVASYSIDRSPSAQSSGIPGSSGITAPVLTTREEQVLKLLAASKITNAIAEILGIRPLTARNHISRLLTKLGCSSRLEAVAVGAQAGLI